MKKIYLLQILYQIILLYLLLIILEICIINQMIIILIINMVYYQKIYWINYNNILSLNIIIKIIWNKININYWICIIKTIFKYITINNSNKIIFMDVTL